MEVSKLLLRYQEGQRDFRQVSLRAANLARAQLAFVNFDQGDLREANLKAAQLAGANLEGAELTNANLAGANLLGATLLSARLIRTNLEGALLSGADLRGAILKQANLRNASCVGIDLSGADLQGANLKDINLKDANLRGANLMGAQWDRADVEGAHFDGAIMPNGEYVVPEEMSNASPGGIDEFNFPTIEERIDDLNFPTLERSFSDEDSQPASAPLPQNPGSEVGTLLFGDVSLDTVGNVNAPASSSPSGVQGRFMPTGMAGASDRGTPLGAGTGGDLQVWIRSKLQKQNQYQFRRLVAQAYGNQCAVTGSRIQPVLKVVSIAEGTKTGQDHPSNGILLRSDFAILFREHLVAIEPTTGTLLLAPSLRESDYQVWENKPLDLPAKESEKPDVVLLQQHISACRWYQAEQSVQQRQRATKVAGATQARHLWRSALQNLLGTKKPEPDPPLESSANPGAGVAATPAAPLSPTVLREPETANVGVDAVHRDDVPTSWNPTSSSSIPKATSPAVPAPIAIPETPPDPVPEEQTEVVTGTIGSSVVPDRDSAMTGVMNPFETFRGSIDQLLAQEGISPPSGIPQAPTNPRLTPWHDTAVTAASGLNAYWSDLNAEETGDTPEAVADQGVFDAQERVSDQGVFAAQERVADQGVFDDQERVSAQEVFDAQERRVDAQDLVQAQDVQAQDLQVQDLQAQDLQAQDVQVQDVQAQDVQAQDLQAQDLQVQDLQAQDTVDLPEQPEADRAAGFSPGAALGSAPAVSSALPDWQVPPEPGTESDDIPWAAALAQNGEISQGSQSATPAWDRDLAVNPFAEDITPSEPLDRANPFLDTDSPSPSEAEEDANCQIWDYDPHRPKAVDPFASPSPFPPSDDSDSFLPDDPSNGHPAIPVNADVVNADLAAIMGAPIAAFPSSFGQLEGADTAGLGFAARVTADLDSMGAPIAAFPSSFGQLEVEDTAGLGFAAAVVMSSATEDPVVSEDLDESRGLVIPDRAVDPEAMADPDAVTAPEAMADPEPVASPPTDLKTGVAADDRPDIEASGSPSEPLDPAPRSRPVVLILAIALVGLGMVALGWRLGLFSPDSLVQTAPPALGDSLRSPLPDETGGGDPNNATTGNGTGNQALGDDRPNPPQPDDSEPDSLDLTAIDWVYPPVAVAELKPILASGEVPLRPEATQAFWRMQGVARKAGIRLYPLLGYLSPDAEAAYWRDQDPTLTGATLADRLRLSNYHSGYGLNIGDYAAPDSDGQVSFQDTAAFGWLMANAATYGFERWDRDRADPSLDRPWHWHYNPDLSPSAQ